MALNKPLRERVWARANARCEYCRMSQAHDAIPFEVDHIIAAQHAGTAAEENLALACFACNHHKGPNVAGIDPLTGQVAPLFHPRRDVWAEHFCWKGAELQGLTAVGRVTIQVLAMNRDFRVALRQAIIDEAAFPPATS